MEVKKSKRLLLIDGNYLLYRSFWGVRGLMTSKGLLVNAVYGFLMSLGKVLEDVEPDLIAVVFDGRGKTWRHKLVDDNIETGVLRRKYKDRTKVGLENFYQQAAIVRKFLKSMNVKYYRRKCTESDDIIGTLVKRYFEKGYETVLFTKDQDFYQLLQYDMKMYKPENMKKYFDAKDFSEKFIVKPSQWCFVGALMGDGSDTIEGIKGVGIKKASLMAKEYGKFKNLILDIRKKKMVSKHGCTLKIEDIKKLKINMKLKRLSDVGGVSDIESNIGINRKQLKKLLKKYEMQSLSTMKFANQLGGICETS